MYFAAFGNIKSTGMSLLEAQFYKWRQRRGEKAGDETAGQSDIKAKRDFSLIINILNSF